MIIIVVVVFFRNTATPKLFIVYYEKSDVMAGLVLLLKNKNKLCDMQKTL